MERLKGTAAIICEFNPFHFGHKHLLDVAHSEYPVVFGIMSGNLIQRGGNACADKYLRASAAVECGFDGVLELPFPFSSLSARDFARAGVHIAEEAGFEALVFGAEDPQAVKAATEIVFMETDVDLYSGRTPESYNYRFRLPEKIKEVKWLDSGENVPFTREDDMVTLNTAPQKYGEQLVVKIAVP